MSHLAKKIKWSGGGANENKLCARWFLTPVSVHWVLAKRSTCPNSFVRVKAYEVSLKTTTMWVLRVESVLVSTLYVMIDIRTTKTAVVAFNFRVLIDNMWMKCLGEYG
ncbi:hypothetical protein FRC15_008248 [Serendipita sp. 397]|nr:hypothetical protein FRC15_008248 [Serendipita sp. 397]